MSTMSESMTAEQLADALHEKMLKRVDRDGEANVTINDLRALARDAYNLAQADLAAAQAVIEQAPHDDGCRIQGWCNQGIPPFDCTCWKSQSSSSALAAHDDEVFDEGWDACRYGLADPTAPRQIPYVNPYRAARGEREGGS